MLGDSHFPRKVFNPPRKALAWVSGVYEARYSGTMQTTTGIGNPAGLSCVKLQDPNAFVLNTGSTGGLHGFRNVNFSQMFLGGGTNPTFIGHENLSDAYTSYRVLRVKLDFLFFKNVLSGGTFQPQFFVFALPTPYNANSTSGSTNPYPVSWEDIVTNPSTVWRHVDFTQQSACSMHLDINLSQLFGDSVTQGDEYENDFETTAGTETAGSGKGHVIFGYMPAWALSSPITFCPPSVQVRAKFLLMLSHAKQRLPSGLDP